VSLVIVRGQAKQLLHSRSWQSQEDNSVLKQALPPQRNISAGTKFSRLFEAEKVCVCFGQMPIQNICMKME